MIIGDPRYDEIPTWAGDAAKMLSLDGVCITAFRLDETQLRELELSTGQRHTMFGKPVRPLVRQ